MNRNIFLASNFVYYNIRNIHIRGRGIHSFDNCFVKVLSNSDPCIQHQVLMEETWRSVTNVLQSGMQVHCDSVIDHDWYRINSTTGNDAVTVCPALDRCGTRFPVWLSGKETTI